MLRLLIIAILISNILAKLDFSSNGFDDNDLNASNLDPVVEKRIDFLSGEPLWVLSLGNDDWISPKLRLGSAEEAKDFFLYVGPMIIRSKRRQSASVKKDDPEHPRTAPPTTSTTPGPDDMSLKTNEDIKKYFLKIINKYALSISTEPDSYITNNTYYSTPSISIYFKGPYTSLVVRLGRKQWHYFINIQSSFPDWFYGNHDTRDSPIQVPENIKIKLFNSLLSLLQTMFGHPM